MSVQSIALGQNSQVTWTQGPVANDILPPDTTNSGKITILPKSGFIVINAEFTIEANVDNGPQSILDDTEFYIVQRLDSAGGSEILSAEKIVLGNKYQIHWPSFGNGTHQVRLDILIVSHCIDRAAVGAEIEIDLEINANSGLIDTTFGNLGVHTLVGPAGGNMVTIYDLQLPAPDTLSFLLSRFISQTQKIRDTLDLVLIENGNTHTGSIPWNPQEYIEDKHDETMQIPASTFGLTTYPSGVCTLKVRMTSATICNENALHQGMIEIITVSSSKAFNEQIGLKLWPNPASNQQVVSLELEKPLRSGGMITVSNLLGQILHTQELTPGINKLAVAGLSPGTYIVLIESNEGRVSKKLIVQ